MSYIDTDVYRPFYFGALTNEYVATVVNGAAVEVVGDPAWTTLTVAPVQY
jgi:hypothetical protein